MPRGVPKAGFRRTKKRAAVEKKANLKLVVSNETDAERDTRIRERFDILEDLTYAAFDQTGVNALIVSGPAGLGKSYTIEQIAHIVDPDETRYTVAKGYVKTTGLYKLLYANREEGQVIVFDDADSVFFDDNSLNLLKAVCDTTDKRIASYLVETNMRDEESQERLPRQFEFKGTIIFITNIDFDSQIEKGGKLAPHLEALMSRSHYIDLAMHDRRDYYVRIKQVIGPIMKARGYSKEIERDVLKFVDKNFNSLRELSLRMIVKIANIRASKNTRKWENVAKVTCCKV